jgi:predicted adenylyl cyclase CyaB
MYEVEVKVPADVDRVAARLDEIGAEHIDSVEQIDTYYDAPHRNFAETDEALRIRAERHDGTEETRVTYKGPLVEAESKTREEFETSGPLFVSYPDPRAHETKAHLARRLPLEKINDGRVTLP